MKFVDLSNQRIELEIMIFAKMNNNEKRAKKLEWWIFMFMNTLLTVSSLSTLYGFVRPRCDTGADRVRAPPHRRKARLIYCDKYHTHHSLLSI